MFFFFKSNIPPQKINEIQNNNDVFKINSIYFPSTSNKRRYILNSFKIT